MKAYNLLQHKNLLKERFNTQEPWYRWSNGYVFDIPDHGFETHFWPLYGHAATGRVVSMSERRPGVSRWREGVGFWVWHVYT